ncbi:hypothetical protein FIBSPDRAFT_901109 [Athelia psychrophila]|uniref:Uncharacterized protein n=1 Tax=Athelia psychrophila TaxID=1759441 RepID=A0A165XK90_9AGAM|nr:hypothetical protein FIBSPDRAFT_901109 [Fibularhizoctonia sp. CBS 109695]
MHNLTSRTYDIESPIAKLSLYNLKDVTVSLGPDARILSSTLEITKCVRLSVAFEGPSAVPAIIQLDPALEDVSFEFQGDARPGAFIVSPRMSQDTPGIGVSGIRVGMGGKVFELVDTRGEIHQELLRSAGGRAGEQYTITCTMSAAVGGDESEKQWVWSMKPVDKIAGGVPVVGGH